MNTEQKLQKEIDRLTKALKQAQALNAGVEADKDQAWELVQMLILQSPERVLTIHPSLLRAYSRTRWTTQVSTEKTGALLLEVREK